MVRGTACTTGESSTGRASVARRTCTRAAVAIWLAEWQFVGDNEGKRDAKGGLAADLGEEALPARVRVDVIAGEGAGEGAR